MSIVVDWNGHDLPEGLKELPIGRYVLESLDEVVPLTEEEDEGLRNALQSVDHGRGVPTTGVEEALRARARR